MSATTEKKTALEMLRAKGQRAPQGRFVRYHVADQNAIIAALEAEQRRIHVEFAKEFNRGREAERSLTGERDAKIREQVQRSIDTLPSYLDFSPQYAILAILDGEK